MQTSTRANTIATGFAMFSMFFGAGNVVFPLALGQYAQSQNFYAILGLLLTGITVPFLGLMAMTLFDGSYRHFFARIGKVPGFLVELAIMALIGPFGATPRTITLSYSTLKMYLPGVSLPIFSAIACVIIYLLTYHRKNVIDILGYILTPLLLLSLVIIIVKGFITSGAAPIADHGAWDIFFHGMKEGYQTMDLMGAFFFSSVVLLCLKRSVDTTQPGNYKQLIMMTLKASCIGAGLLAAVYVGFSYVASFNSEVLANAKPDEMIAILAHHILGPYAGLVACSAVALACLTTAIALSVVFAEFIHEDISMEKIGYRTALVISLAITFVMSTMEFSGIVAFLAPILEVCYPALIALTVVNLLYKLYDFQPVKVIVYGVFLASLIASFM